VRFWGVNGPKYEGLYGSAHAWLEKQNHPPGTISLMFSPEWAHDWLIPSAETFRNIPRCSFLRLVDRPAFGTRGPRALCPILLQRLLEMVAGGCHHLQRLF